MIYVYAYLKLIYSFIIFSKNNLKYNYKTECLCQTIIDVVNILICRNTRNWMMWLFTGDISSNPSTCAKVQSTSSARKIRIWVELHTLGENVTKYNLVLQLYRSTQTTVRYNDRWNRKTELVIIWRVDLQIWKENGAYIYAPFVPTERSDGPCCDSQRVAVRVPSHRNMVSSGSYDTFSNTSAWN
jgi:hypothetical protein